MKSDTIVDEIHENLKKLLNPKRLRHAEGVLDYSVKLARIHGENEESVSIAALYHDYFRNLKSDELLAKADEFGVLVSEWESNRPVLLHGRLAAIHLRQNYPDLENLEQILEAVRFHTSGFSFSSGIGKILFISDSVEVNREFQGVDLLREMAVENLDRTCLEILKNKIKRSTEKGNVILPETINAYNKMIMNGVEIDD